MNGLAWSAHRGVHDLATATVPMADRGHLLGDGVFETMRCHDGHVWMATAHADRLATGLAVLGIPAAARREYEQAVADLATALGLPADRTIRVQVTTGVQDDLAGRDGRWAVTGIAMALRRLPEAAYRDGLRVVTARYRVDPTDPLAGIKAVAFLPHLHAKRAALAAGADDALIRNTQGRYAEATTANLFALRGDTVYAPGLAEGALAGTTRAATIDALSDDERAWTVQQRLTPQDLLAADEAWLSNTSGLAVPVVIVDGARIGDGRPGNLTAWVRDRLTTAIAEASS